jgi:hypothetical protein
MNSTSQRSTDPLSGFGDWTATKVQGCQMFFFQKPKIPIWANI